MGLNACIERDFARILGARVLRIWPLEGGVSAVTIACEAELPGGEVKKFVARQPQEHVREEHPEGAAEWEFRVQTALHAARLPVPAPHFVVPDAEEPGYFVVDMVDGAVDFAPADLGRYLETYAKTVADLHDFKWEGVGLEFLREEPHILKTPTRALREDLREGEVRAAYAAYGGPRNPNPHVLRHGDLWPGNILWSDGEVAAVIDWECAARGEPLDEISVCRLDVLWLFGWDAVADFTQAYVKARPVDTTDLPFWDLRASLRLINAIEICAPAYPKFGRPDVTVGHMKRLHQEFVQQAFEALAKR